MKGIFWDHTIFDTSCAQSLFSLIYAYAKSTRCHHFETDTSANLGSPLQDLQMFYVHSFSRGRHQFWFLFHYHRDCMEMHQTCVANFTVFSSPRSQQSKQAVTHLSMVAAARGTVLTTPSKLGNPDAGRFDFCGCLCWKYVALKS